MSINRIILGILILGIAFQISFAENVKFKSNIKDKDGNPAMLTGILTKPEGKGPFPAAVLLHGGRGMQFSKTLMEPWSNRLVPEFVKFRQWLKPLNTVSNQRAYDNVFCHLTCHFKRNIKEAERRNGTNFAER